jgi:Domain of unknown function (DUF2828)
MLLDAMKNVTQTENGAITFKSTLNLNLDFFARASAMRGQDVVPMFTEAYQEDSKMAIRNLFYLRDVRGGQDVVPMFVEAYNENPQLAIRNLFYLRDVRGGQGERELFRSCLRYIAQNHGSMFDKLVPFIPFYGRWDDLLEYHFIPSVVLFVATVLEQDMTGNQRSLLAKWMPSENASSKKTKELARSWMKSLDYSAKQYRTILSTLRSELNVTERLMSSKDWNKIDYSKVPSRAALKYKKAFKKNDPERYVEYLNSVLSGNAKMNAATLYPYEIVHTVRSSTGSEQTAEALWFSLPDYIPEGKNFLVLADVSASMNSTISGSSCSAMDVSIALALYASERATGKFKNHFITFTTNPTLVQVQGTTLKQRIKSTESAEWDGSTNIQAAFELILNTAVAHKLPQKELPDTLFVVSDMEFDVATNSNKKTNLQAIKSKFKKAGYEMPTLVFWNVCAKTQQVPALANDTDVLLVSGLSATTFQNTLLAASKTPLEFMMEVLNSDRYSRI